MRRFLLLLPLLFLFSCDGDTPRPGSAGSIAAGTEASAQSLRDAATKADLKSAQDKAKAAYLEEIAERTKTKEDIDAAVNAKVQVAADEAAANALHEATDKATAVAEKASKSAADERIKQQQADEQLWWRRVTQIAGAVCIGIGIILGGIICYTQKSLKAGVPLGGILASAGMGVAIYGTLAPWMLIVLGALVLAGFMVWLIVHVKHVHLLDHTHEKLANLESKLQKTIL